MPSWNCTPLRSFMRKAMPLFSWLHSVARPGTSFPVAPSTISRYSYIGLSCQMMVGVRSRIAFVSNAGGTIPMTRRFVFGFVAAGGTAWAAASALGCASVFGWAAALGWNSTLGWLTAAVGF